MIVKVEADLKNQFKAVSASDGSAIAYDHPILKRKRVKRDLSHVVFGPTQ